MRKALVPSPGDILIDLLRVDESTIAEGDANLFAIERDLLVTGKLFVGIGYFVCETADDAAFDERFFNDCLDISGLDLTIEGPLRIDDHHRSHGTKPAASRLDNADFVRQAPTSDFLGHGADHVQ